MDKGSFSNQIPRNLMPADDNARLLGYHGNRPGNKDVLQSPSSRTFRNFHEAKGKVRLVKIF